MNAAQQHEIARLRAYLPNLSAVSPRPGVLQIEVRDGDFDTLLSTIQEFEDFGYDIGYRHGWRLARRSAP